ncbi:MAG: RNA polymerase sigma factor [Candidatus Limnocylindrales bacterium]
MPEDMEGASIAPHAATDRVQAERRGAFDRFGAARLERAYRLAGLILRDQTEAEDAVHDAFIQAWLHWSDLRDRERLDAWFDRILVNECRAHLRRRRIRPLGSAVPAEPGMAEPFAALEERDRLYGALATLDPDHRIAVVLRYVADLSLGEIASRTGAREGTVKSRLHYALRQLRAALDAAERSLRGQR